MRRRVSRLFVDVAAEEFFALVADVEAYPEFLPWCRDARILARRENLLRVAQLFGVGPFVLRFTTEAMLNPPFAIALRSSDPAFEKFRIDWRFAGEAGGCRVRCDVELAFRDAAQNLAARLGARAMTAAIVEAFARRLTTQRMRRAR